jgi:predicted ATPase
VKGETVFKHSLLRDISLTTLKGKYARVIARLPELSNFNFSFKRLASEDLASIDLGFKVTENSKPSTNIHALIGRNGSGKTTILNGMIKSITNKTDTLGQFIDKDSDESLPITDDYFSRLVSVSFSAFDPFEPPKEQSDPSKGTCYFYVGLKNINGDDSLRTISELRFEFVKNIIHCFMNKTKEKSWLSAINKLGSDDNFSSMNLSKLKDEYYKFKDIVNATQPDKDGFRDAFLHHIEDELSIMSSGHAIVLFTITKLVATVEEKTLVLIDEPEGHLHPPLLSSFIRALSELLYDQNGVAIIATHSPVVMQEIPKSCAWIINRFGHALTPYRPKLETFGENVGILTREVFGLEVTNSGYHDILHKSVQSGGTYQEILEAYNNQLGLEARAILKSMVLFRDSESQK